MILPYLADVGDCCPSIRKDTQVLRNTFQAGVKLERIFQQMDCDKHVQISDVDSSSFFSRSD